ncbi:hypothetical protein [Methylocapsa acidiphila]|uniref:hypothetical protein n=1 Tax=Methylocapsa acidiphila TaxID=133552 RepID=UPI001FD98F3C|nr:hypothetical protein [Methylocapsa acidiphila]
MLKAAFGVFLLCASSACLAASQAGTSIPSATQIIDSNGGVWTVGSNGICYVNGAQAQTCNSVTTLLYFQTTIYAGTKNGTWWRWNGSAWNQAPGDPRSTPSASGTTIPSATQFTDSGGNVWTVGSNGFCYINGVQAQTCNSVTTLLYYQNKIYANTTAYGWWIWNGSAWNQVAGNPQPAGSAAVTTYHYDALRTGWNNNELTLSASSFPSSFGVLKTVALDDQVDAQPLFVPGQTIAGAAHDVVYVATASNTIYGIDASTGSVLLQRNLGSPVPAPFGCANNGPNVGIAGTPVIDLAANALYVIAYVNGASPTYQLHALNLTTLADKPGSPVAVAASHKLTDGSTFVFNAKYQRQRPGLLELNGNIYAAFGSFCDYHADKSRGWVLGWNATTLAPLVGSQLNDTNATSPTSWFLSSVWMSGYGLSGAGSEIFFSTGNSDCNFSVNPEACPASTTYNGVTNIQESVVRLSDALQLVGTFAPSNVAYLDSVDGDLGSGGVLLLPTQPGSIPNLAVTAGKDGRLFLLNRDALQASAFNPAAVLDTHNLGGCWCGPSYFVGSDGVGRVVTSQGKPSSDSISNLSTWQLVLSPAPHLVLDGAVAVPPAPGDDGAQDPGFFTVVSSNGAKAGTGIVWAVGRPLASAPTTITLNAYAATASGGAYQLLYSASAGSWPSSDSNVNIVPVVASGKVYVASYQALKIFGPNAPSASASLSPSAASGLTAASNAGVTASVAPAAPNSPHVITGTLLALKGATLTVQTRTGGNTYIDAALAQKNLQSADLAIGAAYTSEGSSFNAAGALQATSIIRAKNSSASWPADR